MRFRAVSNIDDSPPEIEFTLEIDSTGADVFANGDLLLSINSITGKLDLFTVDDEEVKDLLDVDPKDGAIVVNR